jgi:hypothetical protein
MTAPTPNRRWYHPTPARFFTGLLVVQVCLLLSERFRWFPFNEQKGRTVLIALGVVCVAVLVILVWGLVCLCLRLRFQFSFRSLLVFMVAVSVPLGWFGWEMQKARGQRQAVAAIVGLGGVVWYDYEEGEDGYPVDREPTTPRWLRKLFGDSFFCDVVKVDCDGTECDDDDVRQLKEVTNLRELYLGGTQITDQGIEHLNGMTKLEDLSFAGTQITDNGLENVTEMATLKWLSLQGTEVTDDGLTRLKGMTNLEGLVLHDTQITDDSLAHLEGMTKLEILWLGGTQVTDEGVRKLQQALPNCDIMR